MINDATVYLDHIRRSAGIINALSEQIAWYDDVAYRLGGSDYSKPRVTGGKRTGIDDAVLHLMESRSRIGEGTGAMLADIDQCNRLISQLPNQNHQAVLIHKYILGKTNHACADALHISISCFDNWHRAALLAFDELLKSMCGTV